MARPVVWLVTLQTKTCPQHVIRVYARNKEDAGYRAAEQAEREGAHVLRVVRVLPTL